MERNGLDYSYLDDGDGDGEVGVDVLPDRGEGEGEEGKGMEEGGEGGMVGMMGIMEVGGLVVEVARGEVRGRELSFVLGIVDVRVRAELVRLGWGDEGGWGGDAVGGKGGERGTVRLRLRVGNEERERKIEDGSEGEGGGGDEMEMEKGSGRLRLKLRLGERDRVGET